jgi:hypothetical protein
VGIVSAESKLTANKSSVKIPHQLLEIRITGAKAPGEPVSTALGNGFAIGNHLKLAGQRLRRTRQSHGLQVPTEVDILGIHC